MGRAVGEKVGIHIHFMWDGAYESGGSTSALQGL